jgi:hypothetical protein
MSLFTYPIKKLTTLGTQAAGAAALGAKAGIGVVEQIVRTATGANDKPHVQEPAGKADDFMDARPTKVPEARKPKAPATKQGDALADAASSESDANSDATVHPLLADEHIVPEEEVVYSAGPDIEEPIEALLSNSDDERL